MEPITTAAIAGAAGAGKSLEKAGLVKALLLPLAKAYGDHWGEAAKERIAEAIAEKKRKNLESHLEATSARISPESDPDPTLVAGWIEGAASVDPQDEELSAAWRGALEAIGAGNIYRTRMLATVRLLTPDEAHAFLTPSRGRLYGLFDFRGSTLDYRRRFQQLGLIEKPLGQLIGFVFFTLACSAFIGTGAFFWGPSLEAALRDLPAGYSEALLIPFLTLVVATFFLTALTIMFSPMPTEFGMVFKRHARRYIRMAKANQPPKGGRK